MFAALEKLKISEKGIQWYVFPLGVLILIILSLLLWQAWLSAQKVPILAPDAVVLQQAIACSYFRCSKGCASLEVKDNDMFKCKSQFCNPEWTDTKKPDGKICGSNSKLHPVVVTVSSSGGEKLTATSLEQLGPGEDGLNSLSQSGDNCKSGVFERGVIIDKNASLITNTAGTSLTPSAYLSEVLVDQGKYDIWTETLFNFGFNSMTTTVCRSEASSQSAGCGDLGGICYDNSCPASTTPLQGTCAQQGGAADKTKVCCSLPEH